MQRSSHFRRAAALGIALAFAGLGPAQAQFGKNKIQYREFDWKIYHSPHFAVYYYAEEEAIALIVNGFVKEVIQELPMEFAVEAQKLIGISLEGSVG